MKPAFSKWTRQNFAVIDNLWEPTRPMWREFLLCAAMAGIYGRIDKHEGGFRTAETQKEIFRRGDTWVLCPNSMHCDPGLAVDFIILTRVGATVYEYAPWEKLWWRQVSAQYDELRKIGLRLGIDNGRTLWGVDDAHFHYTGSLSTAEVAMGNFPEPPHFKPKPKDKVTMRVIERLGIPTDGLV